MRPYIGLVVVFAVSQVGALAAAASIPKVIQYIIDGPITHHQFGQLLPLAGLLVIIGLLEFVFVYLRRNYSGIASLNMETELRNDFYAHLQNLQISFHDNWQSGQLLSRAIADISTVRRFVSFGLIWFLQIFLTFAVVVVLMLSLDWALTIVVLVCMLPIAYFSLKFHDKYKLIARRLQDQSGDLTTIIEEMATGVRIIKAFGRMPLMQKRFEDQARLVRGTSLEGIKARSELWTQLNFLPNLSLVAVLLLGGFNVVIDPGETVGIVGRTGSGKTTLAYLLPRLYDVAEGQVLLDGIDVRDLKLRSLRSHIGVAFEDPILFSASVHENLVMGRPVVSDKELKRAIDIAQAGFVWELPWGLETRVGEQGYTLSGGQRQRLALARAVLGDPPVLVLDDPLSSVDVHTEAVIEQSLARVLDGVTALLVVHRPSTLALADRVALVDGGTVVATGTHSELLKSNDLYRALLSQEFEPAQSTGRATA